MLKQGKVVGSLIWAKGGYFAESNPDQRGVFTNYENKNQSTWFSDRAAMLAWIEETHPNHILVKDNAGSSAEDFDSESWDVVAIEEEVIYVV